MPDLERADALSCGGSSYNDESIYKIFLNTVNNLKKLKFGSATEILKFEEWKEDPNTIRNKNFRISNSLKANMIRYVIRMGKIKESSKKCFWEKFVSGIPKNVRTTTFKKSFYFIIID